MKHCTLAYTCYKIKGHKNDDRNKILGKKRSSKMMPSISYIESPMFETL